MPNLPAAFHALADLLATAQSNPMLVLALVVIIALVVVGMALQVVRAALEKK